MAKSKLHKELQPAQSGQPKLVAAVLVWLREHRLQLLIFCAALLILFWRRPDAVLNAQFWAEDAEWFQDVIFSNFNPYTLIDPYAGYLTFFQRFIAWLSGALPIELTPLFFNLSALGIQALVLVYVWSKRVTFVPMRMKVFITIVYLLLPYSQEVHANLTNSQWYLAIILFLLVFIKEPQRPLARFFDYFLAAAASLSGPFSILLVPVVALEAYRAKKIKLVHGIVAAGALVQVAVMLLTRHPEPTDIGFSVTVFFQIVGGQVFGSGLFGMEALTFINSKPWLPPIIAVLGVQLLAIVFVKSNYVMRYFLYFSTIILATALVTSLGTPRGYTWWYFFTTEGFGGRYYVLLHLAIYIALGWVLLSTRFYLGLRAIAAGVLVFSFAIGIPNDFNHTPFKDFHYQEYIKEYRQLPPGSRFEVPVNPGGSAWKAVLVKPQ